MPDSSPAPEKMTFEEALTRLEAIVESLEEDLPDLETALASYEEGTTLARHCLQRLEAAELRIEELSLDGQA